MRAFITGLLGLCLTIALLPNEASARADARSSAQSASSSRSAVAARPIASRPIDSRASTARPTASRPVAGRSAAPSSRASAVPSRQASSRTNAASNRQVLVPRSASAGRHAMPGRSGGASRYVAASPGRSSVGNGRHAAAIPYGRQSALPQRGLRQAAMASCTTRHGRRNCAPTRTVSSWTGGLAPAGMSQAGCPDGTLATTAIGHSNITRCVPL